MQMWRIAPLLLPLLLAWATGANAGTQPDPSAPAPADSSATPQSEAGAVPQSNPNAVAPPDAEPAAGTSPEAAQAAGPDNKWHFSTNGYLFLAGAYGESAPRDPLPPVDVHLTPRKALKVFKFGLMGAAEARKGRLIFLGDLMRIHLSGSEGLSIRNRPDFSEVTLNSKASTVMAIGGYRVVDKGPVIVDLMAGGRLNGQKQELIYSGQVVDVSATLRKWWVDPIVATRLFVPLGGKFSLAAYGDIGGFGIGSSFTWQAIGTANYQISRKMRAGLGWRYFKVNYEDNDGFLYKIAQSGPMITLRTDF